MQTQCFDVPHYITNTLNNLQFVCEHKLKLVLPCDNLRFRECMNSPNSLSQQVVVYYFITFLLSI